MKFKTEMLIAAAIAGAPSILLMANVVAYAFLGYGFLIASDDQLNHARMLVWWGSSTAATFIVMVGMVE